MKHNLIALALFSSFGLVGCGGGDGGSSVNDNVIVDEEGVVDDGTIVDDSDDVDNGSKNQRSF